MTGSEQMDAVIVEMRDVKLYRNSRLTIDIDELTIAKGELVAVVGPNGAGKSTLLQIINTLLSYHAGTLKLFGHDAAQADNSQLRHRSAMVFQEALLVSGTVFDNVALPLKFRNYDPQQLEDMVTAALSAFRCQHLAKRSARQLSGGEAQRVCLARALVYSPELLLLDEPFAALDTATRTAILADLKQVAVQTDMTVLLISHNFNDVLYFADRAVVLADGRIVQDVSPGIVLRRPASREVAKLVDMDNILPCQVEVDGEDAVVRMGSEIIFKRPGLPPIEAKVCCLPGDALYILNESSAIGRPAMVALTGVITRLIPGVGSYRVEVNAGGLDLTLRAPRDQAVALTIGSAVEIAFNPQEAQLV